MISRKIVRRKRLMSTKMICQKVTSIIASKIVKIQILCHHQMEISTSKLLIKMRRIRWLLIFCNFNCEEARHHWMKIQAETKVLSRNLCGKLRLVMEPLVATKLKCDYRTGKRISTKRVIGYIASGYQKDKIWLRRTKPATRNYSPSYG